MNPTPSPETATDPADGPGTVRNAVPVTAPETPSPPPRPAPRPAPSSDAAVPASDESRTGDTDGARPVEIGGQQGPEPTRYGDWERKGRCTDF